MKELGKAMGFTQNVPQTSPMQWDGGIIQRNFSENSIQDHVSDSVLKLG